MEEKCSAEESGKPIQSESLEEIFVRELREFEANGFTFEDNARVLYLGKPSTKLLSASVPDLPIVVLQSSIKKAFGLAKGKADDAHELKTTHLETLVSSLQNPVLILESNSFPGAKVVFTEIRDSKGETVIVPLHLNRYLPGKISVNIVPSIHTRAHKKLIDLVIIAESTTSILYIDALKLKDWLRRAGYPQLLSTILKHLPQ